MPKASIAILHLLLGVLSSARDFAGDLIHDNRGILARYGKPVFDGEVGPQTVVVPNEPPRPIERAVIGIAGFAPGSYEMEWRDPWGVKPAERQVVDAGEDGLQLQVARFDRHVACTIRRLPSAD